MKTSAAIMTETQTNQPCQTMTTGPGVPRVTLPPDQREHQRSSHTIPFPEPHALPVPEWHDARPGLWGSHDVLGGALMHLAHEYSTVTRTTGEPVDSRHETEFSAAVEESSQGTDRRIFPRRGARGPVSVARVTEDVLASYSPERLIRETGISGELLDLSRNGLALALLHQLAADDRIFVRLCPPQGGGAVDCFARVIRTIEIADGFWKIVAQFEKPLGFEEAYQLFDRQMDSMS